MEIREFTWIFREGKDREGDPFHDWLLVHGNGRIVATVEEPVCKDGYLYNVTFHIPVPQQLRMELIFIDTDSAKRFIEEVVTDSVSAEEAQRRSQVAANWPPVFEGAVY